MVPFSKLPQDLVLTSKAHKKRKFATDVYFSRPGDRPQDWAHIVDAAVVNPTASPSSVSSRSLSASPSTASPPKKKRKSNRTPRVEEMDSDKTPDQLLTVKMDDDQTEMMKMQLEMAKMKGELSLAQEKLKAEENKLKAQLRQVEEKKILESAVVKAKDVFKLQKKAMMEEIQKAKDAHRQAVENAKAVQRETEAKAKDEALKAQSAALKMQENLFNRLVAAKEGEVTNVLVSLGCLIFDTHTFCVYQKPIRSLYATPVCIAIVCK